MPLPSFPQQGGCQCGAVRYELTEPPLGVYNCHCTDCQKMTGAAFGISMPVKTSAFRHLAGELTFYEKVADSGRHVRLVACAKCGTRVWNDPVAAPDMKVVRPGTLDDPSWAVPVGNVWTSSRMPWVEIDPDMVNFEAQPPSREPLYEAWAALHAGEK
ncbi:hypothetical protein GCM10011321_04920 [Youhaiella tibetensis]|uniref:GFA family protein n=1 Tax=Paradevosia tibetensis TaxID=1447062 RepID=A0A5B9DSA7_9HYPH|nr:GFA family protein [Youhaiella tibetensis]QEE21318.1 GFA family protein [Youhaiella tibetensis]GGF16042.1 hypothetical protein GCM10011321_04920 [Youhaiella tibetensis]